MQMFSPALRSIIVAMSCASMCGKACAAVIYVDDSATGGANNGASWNDAFLDLHEALAMAQAGDEIRIGQGTYKPAAPGSGDRDATFTLVNGVLMQGGFAGTGAANPNDYDPEQFPTILSGDLDGDDSEDTGFVTYDDNSLHVVTADGVSVATEIRGLIITSGSAPGFDFQGRGAGLICIGQSGLRVVECVFRRNYGRDAVGLSTDGGPVKIMGCSFIANRCVSPNPQGYGAGIGAAASVEITNCVFDSNVAFHGGGAIRGGHLIRDCTFINNYGEDGGAIYGANTLINCTFRGNYASFYGGAVTRTTTVMNCIFEGNSASYRGGAIYIVSTILNSVFTGNNVLEDISGLGGAIYVNGSTIHGCTFIGNSDTSNHGKGGAIYKTSPARLYLGNCIIWDNSDSAGSGEKSQVYIADGVVSVNNTCFMGWSGVLGGEGNFGDDPQMIDADGPDNEYGTEDDNPRLQDTSPARDAGDNSYLPKDDFDLDGDDNTTELLPVDLDGLRRIVNGTVDIGAFEWQRPPGCEADIDPSLPGVAGDGNININDLLAVISEWGECDQCVADIDGDGQVNIDDLLQVIASWGTCP